MEDMQKELQNIKILFVFKVLVQHAKQFSKVESPDIIYVGTFK